MSLSAVTAPSLMSLLDAQSVVLGQLEVRAAAAQEAKLAAQEKMRAAVSEYHAASIAAQNTQDTLESMQESLSRMAHIFGVGASADAPAVVTRAAWQARTIVADVLAEIFQVWAATSTYTRVENNCYISPAFVAASVSRHWRAVATFTPSIWTTVQLNYFDEPHAREYVDLVFTRSRGLPLDLKILNAPMARRTETSLADDITIDLLARSRSVDVDFTLSTIDFPDSVLLLFQAPMPRLESLKFSFGLSLKTKDIPVGTQFLTLCPHLKTLALDLLSVHHIDHESIPSVQSFSTRRALSIPSLSRLAGAWHNLKTLEVAVVTGSSNSIISLPALETLTCNHEENPLHRLASDRVPRLRELAIVCSPIAHERFASFLGQAPCDSLTSLTLDCDTTGAFVSLFPLLPNLARLTLTNLDSEDVCAFFTAWAADAVLSHPARLRRLYIRESQFCARSAQAIVTYLALRHAHAQSNSSPVLELLNIVQSGSFSTASILFPVWITFRLKQLVGNVEVDSSRVTIVEDCRCFSSHSRIPSYVLLQRGGISCSCTLRNENRSIWAYILPGSRWYSYRVMLLYQRTAPPNRTL